MPDWVVWTHINVTVSECYLFGLIIVMGYSYIQFNMVMFKLWHPAVEERVEERCTHSLKKDGSLRVLL